MSSLMDFALREAGLTDEERDMVERAVDDDEEAMAEFTACPSPAFDKLCLYFSPEIPYGVLKARTGDPYCWMMERLDWLAETPAGGDGPGLSEAEDDRRAGEAELWASYHGYKRKEGG